MGERPPIVSESDGATLRLAPAGSWTIDHAEALDVASRHAAETAGDVRRVEIDLSGVERLDTAGAWLIHRTAAGFARNGSEVGYTSIRRAHRILIEEVEHSDHEPSPPRRVVRPLERLVIDVGEVVIQAGRDFMDLVGLIGSLIIVCLGYVARPWRIRFTSVIHHLEQSALRAVPIIALMAFLIGGIVEQQGAYQLRAFGAELLSINLAGILVLRELGLLLTAIMVAGRTGSAITAELGSMKMREEVDAMRALALNPVEVLVVPRILALIIAMPLLTFIADIAALAGVGVVAWLYVGVTPTTFLSQLQGAVAMNTFLVGLIKAPFMAVVIGLIACQEGLQVEGSAESLGRHTTAAVVKSIFMVIVLDGIFAMFFAAIDY